MADEVASENGDARRARIDREMDLIAAAIDAFLNRKDAGRFGAGLGRREISVAILLLVIARAAAVSLSTTYDRIRSVVRELCQCVHLIKPPSRWAAA